MKNKENLDIFLENKGVVLEKEQYDYIQDVVYGDTHVANWSVAGSGKSFCLELIKEFLGDSCLVVATTGIANSILFNNKGGNGTAHSVFSLPLSIHTPNHEKKVSFKTSKLFASSDLIKTVIIEEAGMLTPDQLALISKRIKRFNRKYNTKRKQRNIKLVLQGDLLQLGSVISDNKEKQYMEEHYGSSEIYDCAIYERMNFNTHIFSKVLRTKDKVFQSALEVIRYGQDHRYNNCLKWLNTRYSPDGTPKDAIRVTTTNAEVYRANEKALSENPNFTFTLKGELTGEYNLKNCPVEKDLVLKVGMPVITLINDQDENYFNGSYGHITEIIDGTGVYVKFQSTGKEYLVPLFDFEEREYFTAKDEYGNDILESKVIGTFTQVPIKLAACFSVYRMQGRTIDAPLLIDLGDGFPLGQYNPWGIAQAYTALSRATKIEHIYLKQPLNQSHLKCNRKAVNWVLSKMINKHEAEV